MLFKSLKIADDIGPATKVMTDVAGSTISVVSEAIVCTSDVVSKSVHNMGQELSEFAEEMQNGPPQNNVQSQENAQSELEKPTNV